MYKLPLTLKDDFMAIHRDMRRAVAIATSGDPEKLIEFPKEHWKDRLADGCDFRLYMLNPEHIPVMILPSVENIEMAAILTIAFSYSSLSDQDRIRGVKNLAGSMKRIVEHVENGIIKLTDLFQIWLFTGQHLLGCYEIDSTTACRLALCSAHLNSYDHIEDSVYIDGIIKEVVTELDGVQ